MNETLDWYRVFVFCAENKNYSKAAEQLFISQSAVSQSIKQLEEHVGMKLFYRQGRKMVLTNEGEALYAFIAPSLNTLQDVRTYLQGLKTLDIGTLHIGASDTITRYYLMQHIMDFTERYPNVKIRIDNRPSPTCIRLAEEGKVDIAFVNASNKSNSSMTFTTFSYVNNIFIAHKDSGLSTDRTYTIKELAQYPLITLESPSSTRHQLNDYLANHQVTITPRLEFSSMDLIVDCVSRGLGIGFLARQVAKTKLNNGEIIALNLKEKLEPIPMAIVTNPKRQLSLAAKTFMKLVTTSKK